MIDLIRDSESRLSQLSGLSGVDCEQADIASRVCDVNVRCECADEEQDTAAAHCGLFNNKTRQAAPAALQAVVTSPRSPAPVA